MLDRPVQFSLLARFTSERNCRTIRGGDECVAFIDQIYRSVNLNLSTSVRGFEMGVTMSYDDRESFVGQQTGSTQFQLTTWGQLSLASGVVSGR